jgi:predicted SnoaL-like aldol condensation-catalyzing enzyme
MKIMQKNKELVETFCNVVFIDHDLSDLEQFMREDYIQHNADVPQGRAGFTEFFEKTFRAMPDFRYSVKQIVAGGDPFKDGCSGGLAKARHRIPTKKTMMAA